MCQERDLGVMTIKAAARRPWPDRRPLTDVVAGDPATADRWATSWYEPQATDDDLARGIAFRTVDAGCPCLLHTGRRRGLLPRVLDAADQFVPMTDEEREAAVSSMADEPVIFPIPR